MLVQLPTFEKRPLLASLLKHWMFEMNYMNPLRPFVNSKMRMQTLSKYLHLHNKMYKKGSHSFRKHKIKNYTG